MTREEFIEALATATDPPTQRALVDGHLEFVELRTVLALKERADLLERDNAHQALSIGQAAAELAERLASDEARGTAWWIQANAHDSLADLDNAARAYESGAQFFTAAGKPLEAARTSIGLMFTLMKMGQFEKVQSLAESARLVFVEHGDLLSQAKIDMNLGNLQFRQGQYVGALQNFKQAAAAFHALGDDLYAAMNQVNQANTLTVLDDFLEAERLYEGARPFFETADLRAAVASLDHDLAFLQSARGKYGEALRSFERARDVFAGQSDRANVALTELEESDLYLDLNLPVEAQRLAEQCERVFAQTGMGFEIARARTNQGVAQARLGRVERAESLLGQARDLFAAQGNDAWVAHTELQRAEVMGQHGERERARLLASQALKSYEMLGMKTKQAYAQILCANLWADDRAWPSALGALDGARAAVGSLNAPWLEQRIDACRGRVHEGLAETALAVASYEQAVARTEQMAAALTAEEQRTAFVMNKLAPYEALVALCCRDDPSAAFRWAEQAKARALIDLLAAGISPRLRTYDEADSRLVGRLHDVREELNWLYTRLTRGANPGESAVPAAGPETWAKIEQREREATSLWRDLQARHAEALSLIRTEPPSPAEIQTELPPGTALLEYFIGRGEVTAFLLTRERMHAYPAMVSVQRLLPLLEDLGFQFSKFQYGEAYFQRHRAALLTGVEEIFAQLGEALIAPLSADLAGVDALIVVPHGPLHALPFQALRLNNRYLVEDYAVSHAPSAAVLRYCWLKAPRSDGGRPFAGRPLLVGVPDERVYHVAEEIQHLAGLFGDAEILLGEQATFASLVRLAPDSGVIHLAAHGLYRPEAPLLSSIHLADRWLTVQDIYDLDLSATLVGLSACETGLGGDAGGDDMMGLVRGFLHAGASALLVNLWTVDDESMTRLVTDFYTRWLTGLPKGQALRQAELNMLKTYEHPYFWAPLALVGNER